MRVTQRVATAIGITKGCNLPSNYYYCPSDQVTRGQMAAFLARALDLPHGAPDAFSDDDQSIFQADINALAGAGIAKGCNPPKNTLYCPDDVVTRGQMAAFLDRAFHFAVESAGDSFIDDEGSIFEADINRLAAAGITRGCNPPTNSQYCPDDPVRRDQMATFLARSLGLDPLTPPPAGHRLVIAHDTLIENERLTLRSGESIEFRNGATLMIGSGASVDWQGTPTTTWSNDGLTQNLDRDVRIFGRGDIMFMKGSTKSTIRYVDIDLQPIEELDHYPLHWHHVGDGSRGTLVEGVVVENSTNRAFVPHASHGITFRDTIAKNIAGEAYWWNPPPHDTKTSWRLNHSNNSSDIRLLHALADGVTNAVGDARGYNLSAFQLGAGSGNIVRDSIARGVLPTNVKNCAGFEWPAIDIHQPSDWTFDNNKTFESACNGIFVWQNRSSSEVHLVDGFVSTEPIADGAYSNGFEYRNVEVPYVVVHAVGWSITGGQVDSVRMSKHQTEGTVTFSHVAIHSATVDNASNGGTSPGHYLFTATGLSCGDVTWISTAPGTTLEIDGESCVRTVP